MRPTSILLFIALFFTGFVVARIISPEYLSSLRYKDVNPDLGGADRWFDDRYMDAVTQNFAQTEQLIGQIQYHTKRPEFSKFAFQLLQTQKKIDQSVNDIRQKEYGKGKSASRSEPLRLGKEDDTFDLRAINALLQLQTELQQYSKQAQRASYHQETLQFADQILQNTQQVQAQLLFWRKGWYGID